jgi:peptide chain release factor subunit 1
VRPVADETEDVPGQHDQGGWSQPRYQRHIEAIVGRHLRRVAESLASCVRGAGRTPLVLIGPEEIRAEFEELLSNDVRECIVGWTAAEAHATAAELLAAARPVIDAWWSSKEGHLLDRWREAAGRDGRASAGWEKTLEAASDGRVAQLLVQQGADRNAYRCPVCGRARTTNGVCPLDGAELEEHDDALDLALRQTLAHGGTVTLIRERLDLQPVEGIGALLRF